MIICWDNLNKLKYSARAGNWITDSKTRFVYVDECAACKHPFLASKSSINERKNGKCGPYAGRFCSAKCKNQYIVGRKHPRYKSRNIICDSCGVPFKTNRKNSMYCSVACKNNGLKKDKVNMVCVYCGGRYDIAQSAALWSKKRGRKHNFCSKDCQYSFYAGENSPAWIDDRDKLKNQDHSARWSSNMADWRRSVYVRDNYTCVMCNGRSSSGNPVTLNAHHVRTFSKHHELRFELSNGVSLCEKCHKLTYKKEASFEAIFDNYIQGRKDANTTS